MLLCTKINSITTSLWCAAQTDHRSSSNNGYWCLGFRWPGVVVNNGQRIWEQLLWAAGQANRAALGTSVPDQQSSSWDQPARLTEQFSGPACLANRAAPETSMPIEQSSSRDQRARPSEQLSAAPWVTKWEAGGRMTCYYVYVVGRAKS